MAISLKKGHRVKLEHVDVFADGVAIKQPGAECFNLCRELCDGILLVNNASTSAAVKDVFNETRAILEPAGAVALAGARDYLQTRPHIKVSRFWNCPADQTLLGLGLCCQGQHQLVSNETCTSTVVEAHQS